VKRNPKGKVLCANFRPVEGANPLRATCNMGQRYSYQERVGDYRAWRHAKQLTPRDPEAAAFVALVFGAVPVSIFRHPGEENKRVVQSAVHDGEENNVVVQSSLQRRAA
jgi:hypothetical protein